MAEEDNAGMVDVEDAAPEQAKEEEPAAEGGKTMVAGVALDETQLPLFVALIASIVLLIATTSRYNSYSVSYVHFILNPPTHHATHTCLAICLHAHPNLCEHNRATPATLSPSHASP